MDNQTPAINYLAKISESKKPKWWDRLQILEIGNAMPLNNMVVTTALNLHALDLGETCYTSEVNGYLTNIEDLKIIKEFIDTHKGQLLIKGMSNGPDSNLEESLYVWENGCMEIDLGKAGNINARICHFNQQIVEAFNNEVRKLLTVKKGGQGKAFCLGAGRSGLELMSIGKAGIEFVPGNYSEEVVKAYEHIVSDLKSSEPCGRVNIFDGPPGGGKSYILRSLMLSVADAIFIVVPSHMISSLGNPELIPLLMRTRRQNPDSTLIVIAEDADQVLSTRGADNISSISALLNFGDGIIGAMMDVRIIATTNIDVKDIDPAIMRPGRLCRRVEINPLTRAHANEVFKRLTGKDGPFKDKGERYTLATVYSAAKNNGWEPPKKARAIGFTSNDDDGEDIVGHVELALYVADSEDDFLSQLNIDDQY